jgi:hypothetical protein
MRLLITADKYRNSPRTRLSASRLEEAEASRNQGFSEPRPVVGAPPGTF